MERRGERRRKKVGKDGQIDRQTAERQAHQPPPHTHPAPQTQLVAPGLSFAEITPHISLRGLHFCHFKGAPLFLDPLLQA